jgi:hypothetical protein
MCKSCYNKSKLTAEAIAKTNASDAAKQAKQLYEDKNREERNALRKEYARHCALLRVDLLGNYQ